MLIEIIKPGVTDTGSIIDVGAVIDFPDSSAESLVKGGWAKAVEAKKVDKPVEKATDKPTKKATKA